jgi:hypothetical protein
MPSFHEWLLARGALPIQGRINPFPTAKAHRGRLRGGPFKPPQPAAQAAAHLFLRRP